MNTHYYRSVGPGGRFRCSGSLATSLVCTELRTDTQKNCHNQMMSAPGDLHDYAQAVRTLESTIGDDSRPVGILMGAGCSSSVSVNGAPLIASIEKLTADVEAEIGATPMKGALTTLIQSHVDDGAERSTIEDWLSRLRTMALIAGNQATIRGITSSDIVALEKAIVASIATRVSADLPVDGGGFDSLALWASTTSRKHALTVFTLNYDLLVEQAFERHRVAYFDGFVGAHKPFLDARAMEDDNLPARWSRVWKMHGSVNWRLNNGTVYRTVAGGTESASHGSLIHPSNMKYEQSRRGPYLAMQDRLRSFLRQPGAVILCLGYSFGDQHINEMIVEGLSGNATAVVFAPLFGELGKYEAAIQLSTRLQNLRLMASDAAVIGGRLAGWRGDDARDDFGEPPTLGDFAKFADLLDRQSVVRSNG
jgi:hypothetical protein